MSADSSLGRRTIRHYFWLIRDFTLKHSKLILISSFISFLIIVSIISLTPYLTGLFFTQKKIIGMVGNYDYNNLPEEVSAKISNGLIFINEKGRYIPALASSWEILDSGSQFRFHLRDGLIWSNGEKFSAVQLKYNFKDVDVKIIDAKTLVFSLKKPLPIFPLYLKEPVIKYPLVGLAGLYKVDKIRTKYGLIREMYLSPNKKNLPTLIYKFFNDETSLIKAYKLGEINQFTTSKKSLADFFRNWKNSVTNLSVDYNHLMTLFYNFKSEFLRSKENREALSQAIDFTQFAALGDIALGPLPPNSWAFNSDLKKTVYNPAVANKILSRDISATSSGKLTIATYYDYLDVADSMNDFLSKAGLSTSLVVTSSDKLENFDFFLALWKVPQDPDQYYFWHSTQIAGNIGGYKNVRVDKLLEEGRNKFTADERIAIYREYQKIIVDDPPALFLYFPYAYTISRR